jgi:hypothetical protein
LELLGKSAAAILFMVVAAQSSFLWQRGSFVFQKFYWKIFASRGFFFQVMILSFRAYGKGCMAKAIPPKSPTQACCALAGGPLPIRPVFISFPWQLKAWYLKAPLWPMRSPIPFAPCPLSLMWSWSVVRFFSDKIMNF